MYDLVAWYMTIIDDPETQDVPVNYGPTWW